MAPPRRLQPGLEQPHADRPDEGGPPSHWCRAYGPPEPGGTWFQLWQGEGPPYDLSVGDEWEVRGMLEVDERPAPLWRARAVSAASVSWRRDSTDLTVMARSPHGSDPLPGLKAFLAGLTRS